jgi:hypothetical protein
MISGWISPLKLRQLGIMGMNRRNISYISRYNPRHRYPLVDNKLKTKVVAQKARLRVPCVTASHWNGRLVSHAETSWPLSSGAGPAARAGRGRGAVVARMACEV